jgi:DinB family protein
LLQAAAGLSAEQQCFRCAADRWSVADCVEHITVVEGNILKTIERLLETPPPAEKPDTEGKDQVVLDRVPGRATRVKGPPSAMPQGRWPNFQESVREFEATRERTRRFAAATQGELRAFAFPHPFLGPLDCYQWLLFLAAHCERHVRQMEEVKSDPAFPVSAATEGGVRRGQ